MAQLSNKLAQSLAVLKAIQDTGQVAIPAEELTRTHRERLLKGGFIRPVMRGWYIASRPDEQPGESTGWYASFWRFCAAYLEHRFSTDWCLSPEQSLSLHTGNRTVPRQLLVRSPQGGNKPFPLPFDTSLFDVRLKLPPSGDMVETEGLRLFSLPAALIACAPGQFTTQPVDLQAALAMITDASAVLPRLLEGGHSVVAGRLVGALRAIGRTRVADQIAKTMRTAGFVVNETHPFADRPNLEIQAREISPYINRMRLMWERMREPILRTFPASPGLTRDATAFLKSIDDLYITDAYNSLSIEGYRVSAQLIERVQFGNWNPDNDENDRQNKNALAARGYWQAFQSVKASITKILAGQNPGEVIDRDSSDWYAQIFQPSVAAGILGSADLAGYRNGPVYIRRSMHVPPSAEAVREMMPTFFELLRVEPEPAVRAVLGHFIFVYIHPYMDGNGRVARFLMNAMLASGGYSWTIIPIDRRNDYMASLGAASAGQDIQPFTTFLRELVEQSLRKQG